MNVHARYGATPLDPDEERYLADLALIGKSKAELDALEQDGLVAANVWVRRTGPDLLDELTLRAIHRKAFEKVWTWAGVYRSVELSIGIDPSQIAIQMSQLFGSLQWRAENNLFDHTDVARSHLVFTGIHPFHNGNGRLARMWAMLLADEYSLPRPVWGSRRDYIAVLRSGDEEHLTRLMYPEIS